MTQIDIVPIFSGLPVRNGGLFVAPPLGGYVSPSSLNVDYSPDMYHQTWAYPAITGGLGVQSEYAGRMQTNYIVTSGVSSGISS